MIDNELILGMGIFARAVIVLLLGLWHIKTWDSEE